MKRGKPSTLEEVAPGEDTQRYHEGEMNAAAESPAREQTYHPGGEEYGRGQGALQGGHRRRHDSMVTDG